jgi:hypothetical protein
MAILDLESAYIIIPCINTLFVGVVCLMEPLIDRRKKMFKVTNSFGIKDPWRVCVFALVLGLLCFCIAWLAVERTAESRPVLFTWDANIEDDLDGYKLYSGVESGEYGQIVKLGKVTSHKAEFDGGDSGQKYYAALTAFDTKGNESDFSVEVTFVVPERKPPAPPGPIQVEIESNQFKTLLKVLGKRKDKK